jgi:hypothetical protein
MIERKTALMVAHRGADVHFTHRALTDGGGRKSAFL